jgi:hypothetical protein
VKIARDSLEKGLPREAYFHQEFALVEHIDLAITVAVYRIVPLIDHRAPLIEIADGRL